MLSAKVLEDGEVLVINKSKLEKELTQNGALTFEFMKWMSTHLRKIQSKIRDLLLHGKRGALLHSYPLIKQLRGGTKRRHSD